MVKEEIAKLIEDDRRDGVSVFAVPLRLDLLVAFVQEVFPGYTLEQLAITEADDGQFAVEPIDGPTTKAN